jgi:uncharacterized repeat protein (TIGR03943 family)
MIRTVALGCWAAFFWWLSLSGEVTRYLGPRTLWVSWFGAIGLTIAAAVLFSLDRSRRATPRDVVPIAIMLLPLAAVLAAPAADLGAHAVSRKTSAGALAAGTVLVAEDVNEVGFREIALAERSTEFALRLGIGEGMDVDLFGFVSDIDSGGFDLARFYVSCCAADAIPYVIGVDAPNSESYETDEWLRVTGTLARRGESFVVVPDEIRRGKEPREPYLY